MMTQQSSTPPNEVMTPAVKPDKEFVQSLVKGISVITAFSRENPAMTLSQVAALTGLTRATARRFLLTLHDLGYVKTDGRLFKLAPKILELGYAFLSSFHMGDIAEPFLQQVTDKVQESAGIAVLDGNSVVFVGPVHKKHVMSFSVSIGSKLPAYCTALGRLMLSDLPLGHLDQYLRELQPEARTDNTVTDKEKLRDLILQAAHAGYCIVDQELEVGLRCCAVPIRNRAGRMIAAINVSSMAQRASVEEMKSKQLPALIHASEQIMSAYAA